MHFAVQMQLNKKGKNAILENGPEILHGFKELSSWQDGYCQNFHILDMV